MPIGVVKWFSLDKGYGFIAPSEGGNDVFVHANAVRKSRLADLTEGQTVGYELEIGRQGKSSAGQIEVI